jgi:hypothetical protein
MALCFKVGLAWAMSERRLSYCVPRLQSVGVCDVKTAYDAAVGCEARSFSMVESGCDSGEGAFLWSVAGKGIWKCGRGACDDTEAVQEWNKPELLLN